MNIKKMGSACLLMVLYFNSADAYRGRKGSKNTQAKTSTVCDFKTPSRMQKSDTSRFSFMANLKNKFMGSSDRLRPSRSEKAQIAQTRAELKKSQEI